MKSVVRLSIYCPDCFCRLHDRGSALVRRARPIWPSTLGQVVNVHALIAVGVSCSTRSGARSVWGSHHPGTMPVAGAIGHKQSGGGNSVSVTSTLGHSHNRNMTSSGLTRTVTSFTVPTPITAPALLADAVKEMRKV
jgi:hypothetical protein